MSLRVCWSSSPERTLRRAYRDHKDDVCHKMVSNLQLNHKIASLARNDGTSTMKKIRLVLAIIILSISISLLIWAYFPNQTETRIQDISPQEMQLPTPSSFHYEFVA